MGDGVGTGVAEGVGAGLSVAWEARSGEGTGTPVGLRAGGSIVGVEDVSTGASRLIV